MLEGLALQPTDQFRRRRTFPLAGVPMFFRAPDPPALPGKSVRLAYDQYCQFGLTMFLCLVIDKG
jgi:hypothetical protein